MAKKAAKPVRTEAETLALVAVVKDRSHEKKWYERGWDNVVETLSDAEIAGLLGTAKTTRGAIRNVYQRYVKPMRIVAENQGAYDATELEAMHAAQADEFQQVNYNA